MVILWVNIRVRPPPSWNSVFGTTWLRFSSRSWFRARARNLVGPGPDNRRPDNLVGPPPWLWLLVLLILQSLYRYIYIYITSPGWPSIRLCLYLSILGYPPVINHNLGWCNTRRPKPENWPRLKILTKLSALFPSRDGPNLSFIKRLPRLAVAFFFLPMALRYNQWQRVEIVGFWSVLQACYL